MGLSTLSISYDYDAKYDVLYLSIGTPKEAYGDEIDEGIVIRKDFKTNEVVGLTIIGFKDGMKSSWLQPYISKLPNPFTTRLFKRLQETITKQHRGTLTA